MEVGKCYLNTNEISTPKSDGKTDRETKKLIDVTQETIYKTERIKEAIIRFRDKKPRYQTEQDYTINEKIDNIKNLPTHA